MYLSVFEKLLQNVTVVQTQEAVFSCDVIPETVNVIWSHNGKKVTGSNKYVLQSDGNTRRLTIKDCKDCDKGTIKAILDKETSSAILQVKGIEFILRLSMLIISSLS